MSQFSVIVPTIGRPTLVNTIESCVDPLVEEVLVSPDGRQASDVVKELFGSNALSKAWFLGVRLLEPVDESRMNQWGHPQRNRACMAARAPWLLFMDDDDVFVEGAFSKIALSLDSYRPHIFQMRYGETMNGQEQGSVLWEEPELRECNVGSPMFVIPNRQLGWWPSRQAGDWGFIQETCALQGEPVFVEQVICEVRPSVHATA